MSSSDSTSAKPRVRFAPSPTGFLHVGSARTFIFNWLYARRTGGTMILRLDDTDVERNTDASVTSIFEGLKWLGLGWDEEYKQSERGALHRQMAAAIFEKGLAYRDFTPAHTGDSEKSGAQGTWLFNPGMRELSREESDRRAATGEPFALRFRVPREGGQVVRFNDAVYGEQMKEGADIEDFALLRSDGMPTYHLASCADDADLRISHIIRGQDHLSNTFKHVLIFEAAGYAPPQFAHLPLLVAPDGTKLSKRRHGPVVSVTTYRDAGFLPEAFINFLCLLGWSPKNDREQMSVAELIEAFSLEGINRADAVVNFKEPAELLRDKSPSFSGSPLTFNANDTSIASVTVRTQELFDPKAVWLNGQHIRSLNVEDLTQRLLPVVHEVYPQVTAEKMLRITPLIRERIELLRDVLTAADFFFVDQLPPYDPAELIPQKGDAAMAVKALQKAQTVLPNVEFKHDPLDQALRAAAQELGLKAGQMFQPIRVAVCGRKNAPPLFETLEVLGKETTLARIGGAVTRIAPMLVTPAPPLWDVFISYASEDARVATAVARELQRYGLEVWFAPFVLEVGDSLRQKIDEGLSRCRYGVVLLSKAFFRKQWPKQELDALFSRHIEGPKVLLPVRRAVSQSEMNSYSSILASIYSDDMKGGAKAVARRLVKVIKPGALELPEAFAAASDAGSRIAEQIKAIDARVYARVQTGPGVGESAVGPGEPPPRGILASLAKEGTRIDLFASDPRAFNEAPWQAKMRLTKEGHAKIDRFLKTGERTVLSPAESTVSFEPITKLFPGAVGAGAVLDTAPWVKAKRHQFRLTFCKDDRRVDYPLVEFVVESVGAEQVRIVSRTETLPLKMSLTFRPLEQRATFSFSASYLGHEIRDVSKAKNALEIARSGGYIDIFHLASDRLLTRLQETGDFTSSLNPEGERMLDSFVHDAFQVAVAFDKKIFWHRELRREDIENAAVLSKIINAGVIELNAESFQARASEEQARQMLAMVPGEGGGFFHRESGESYSVLDTVIDPGPHDIYFLPSSVVFDRDPQTGPSWVTVKLSKPLVYVFPKYYPGASV